MKRGEIVTSRTGRTKYAVVAFSKHGDNVQMFVYGPQSFRSLLRQQGVAKRISRRLKLRK